MTSLELTRWQFGITTLYHFIFVPVTIGLATFTAYCHALVPHGHDAAGQKLAFQVK